MTIEAWCALALALIYTLAMARQKWPHTLKFPRGWYSLRDKVARDNKKNGWSINRRADNRISRVLCYDMLNDGRRQRFYKKGIGFFYADKGVSDSEIIQTLDT